MKTLCNWPQSRSARVLTAMLVLTVFGAVAVSVSDAQTPSYALSVSTNSNHSSAIALQGATLSGNVYVFTSSATKLQNYDPSGIAHVCYWLDNPSMTGTARHCEYYMPYDFISSVNNTASSPGNPWNTAQVAKGTHTITQAVTLSAGGSEVDTATFSVQTGATNLVSLAVTPTNVAISLGTKQQFTATGTFSNGSKQNVTTSVSWSSSATGVATISNASGSQGLASSVATGSTTIKAVSGSVSGSTTLTIQASQPTITFTANPTTIPQGQSSTLTWNTNNATSVSINGIGEVSSGSESVSPTVTTTYTLTATGPGGTATVSVTVTVGTATVQHYEYVICDGTLYVYSLDSTNFPLVKQVSLPNSGTRGVGAFVGPNAVGAPNANTLYISYGYDGQGGISVPGTLLAYDLLNDTVPEGWPVSYSFGVDSFGMTPNGKYIYMPAGVSSGTGIWRVIDALNGSYTGNEINTGGNGAHDTVVSLDGSYVFMGLYSTPEFFEGSTSSNTLSETIAGLKGGVSPFTINYSNTLAFVTHPGYFGFEVLDLTNPGKVLYSVPVGNGFSVPPGTNPDHGISLSPDETQIYLIDTVNGYAHVFDVSGLPSTPPKQLANDVKLTTSFTGNQSPCLYDCEREGWIRHTLDGQYVIVGDSGDVIKTSTQTVMSTTLPQLYNTRVYVEIDWNNGVPIATSTREGLGYVGAP